MDIFLPVRFRTQVQLAPNSIVGNIDEQIYKKIRSTLEGVCSRYGYIRPNSIEILKRSLGIFMKAHFNGHIKYDIMCKADICNPVRGMIFKAIVKNKNDLGILAENYIMIDGQKLHVLDVLIPRRSAGITSDIDLDTINIGDEIFIEVLGKRYQLNDKKISIIARAVREPSKKKLKDTERQKYVAGSDMDEHMDGGKDCEQNDDYNATEPENDDSNCDSDEEEDSEDDEDDDESEKSEESEESEEEESEVEESEEEEPEDEEAPYVGGDIGNDEF